MTTAATHTAGVSDTTHESASTRPPLISEDWLSVLVGGALIVVANAIVEWLEASAQKRAEPVGPV